MSTNILYNREEKRLRAFWRILLQGILFLLGLVLSSILIGIIQVLPLLFKQADLRDPQVIQSLVSDPRALLLSQALSPLGVLLSSLLVYWIAARWLDRRAFRSFGFHFNRRWWTDFAFGLFLGAILMVFIFLIERSAGWVTVTGVMQSRHPQISFWPGVIASLIAFICVGIYEEMLSRGYQLRNMAEGFNWKVLHPRTALLLAYLISSSIFGMLHLLNSHSSLISTLNLIVAGLFLGLGYILTGELAISIGLHITWNFFQGNVFGFPVSGGTSAASFIAIQQGGPEIWTGGLFGPEAGLVGILAIALGCLLICLWVRWQYGALQIKKSLAVYTPEEAGAGLPVGLPAAQPSLETTGG